MSHVNELRKAVNEIELKILRGTGPQLVEYMKSGEAELTIAASIGVGAAAVSEDAAVTPPPPATYPSLTRTSLPGLATRTRTR